jgi:hypothetical protein
MTAKTTAMRIIAIGGCPKLDANGFCPQALRDGRLSLSEQEAISGRLPEVRGDRADARKPPGSSQGVERERTIDWRRSRGLSENAAQGKGS